MEYVSVLAVEFSLMVLTVAIILKLCFPNNSLKEVLTVAFLRLSRSGEFRNLFMIILVVFGFACLESTVDDRITHFFGKDYTHTFYHFEGLMAISFQNIQNPVLTDIMAFFYMIVFPSLIISAPIVYAFSNNLRAMVRLVFFYALNFIIAFPFYIFLPVKEVWVDYSPEVKPLLLTVHPYIGTLFKYTNGINNCFPSLHVSISFSLFLISLAYHDLRFKMLNLFSAFAVTFSTLYLGIHWLTDIVAGIALSVFLYLSYSLIFESRLVRVRVKVKVPEIIS
jgi:membrane-associated phospholipid phosphatase